MRLRAGIHEWREGCPSVVGTWCGRAASARSSRTPSGRTVEAGDTVETFVFSNECLNLGQRPRRLFPAIIHDGTSNAECSNGGLPAGIEEPGRAHHEKGVRRWGPAVFRLWIWRPRHLATVNAS